MKSRKGVIEMKKNTLGSLVFLRISRFASQSNQLSNQFLKPYNMTAAKFDVLVRIEEFQPITQQELAKKVTVTQGGMSRMLDRIENDGLIYREVDWKTKKISLTKEGQEKLNHVYSKQLAFQTSLFDDCLTKKEQKELSRLMKKLESHTASLLK